MSLGFVVKETRVEIAFSELTCDKINKMLEESGNPSEHSRQILDCARNYLAIARRMFVKRSLTDAQRAAQESRKMAEAAMRSLWLDETRESMSRAKATRRPHAAKR